MAAAAPNRVDTATLMRIKSLELRARRILEGFMQGLHRSPFHGSSVEFKEYRGYTVGDDPRFIDWKLYARSDRFCVKKFEAETNLVCHCVVDLSKSMGYSTQPYTKAEFAATLAATFAQFLFGQGDTVGLVTFADRIHAYVPPKRRHGQMHSIAVALEAPLQGKATDVRKSLNDLLPALKSRGLVVLISDLLADTEAIISQLTFLRSCGHDVIVFHVLDPAERTWTFDEAARFQDMETGEIIQLDPALAGKQYLEKLAAHEAQIAKACSGMGIDFLSVSTNDSFEKPLHELLSVRSRLSRTGRSR